MHPLRCLAALRAVHRRPRAAPAGRCPRPMLPSRPIRSWRPSLRTVTSTRPIRRCCAARCAHCSASRSPSSALLAASWDVTVKGQRRADRLLRDGFHEQRHRVDAGALVALEAESIEEVRGTVAPDRARATMEVTTTAGQNLAALIYGFLGERLEVRNMVVTASISACSAISSTPRPSRAAMWTRIRRLGRGHGDHA